MELRSYGALDIQYRISIPANAAIRLLISTVVFAPPNQIIEEPSRTGPPKRPYFS